MRRRRWCGRRSRRRCSRSWMEGVGCCRCMLRWRREAALSGPRRRDVDVDVYMVGVLWRHRSQNGDTSVLCLVPPPLPHAFPLICFLAPHARRSWSSTHPRPQDSWCNHAFPPWSCGTRFLRLSSSDLTSSPSIPDMVHCFFMLSREAVAVGEQ